MVRVRALEDDEKLFKRRSRGAGVSSRVTKLLPTTVLYLHWTVELKLALVWIPTDGKGTAVTYGTGCQTRR